MRALRPLLLLPMLMVSSCDLTEALGIFQVRFSLAEDSPASASLMLPQGYRDAATAISSPSSIAGIAAISRLATQGISGDLTSHFTERSRYGVRLTLNLVADNSGNRNRAVFGVDNRIDLHIQELRGRPVSTSLPGFSVGAGQRQVIEIPLEVPLTSIPDATFGSIVRGDDIPYRVAGTVGFSLQSPLGDTLNLGTTTMDLVTDSLPTRPADGASGQEFLNIIQNLL